MNKFIKLAWRNMLRNKRRTFIAGTAIGIGLAAMIFTDAIMVGMERYMINSATSSFLGDGQIHHADFRLTNDVSLTINNLDRVTKELKNDTLVDKFTERTLTFGMITSPANVSAVSLVGVNPSTEKNLSRIDDAVDQGTYFEGDNEQDLVIGYRLADLLDVELGDRIVITAAQAHTGDLAQELFRISGIYNFGDKSIDQGMAFIRLKKSQDMLNLGHGVHEIAMKLNNQDVAQDKTAPFWKKYSTDGNEAVSWVVIMPEIKAVFEMANFLMVILGLILFGVVSLGIINTLFMSLHERMFEFGVMRAVGTSPFAMGRLIIFEACALALISIVIGAIIGYVATSIVDITGIDYSGIESVGITYREPLYPILQVRQFIIYPIAVFIFTAIIGLYPARYAARISPAEAMRKGQ